MVGPPQLGREPGQGQSDFAGELPEDGHEDGKGTWRVQWSILRREQWLALVLRLGTGGSIAFVTKTVVDSQRPSASTVILGARTDIGPDMVLISLSLFPVAVTGQQPSGPTGQAQTVMLAPHYNHYFKLYTPVTFNYHSTLPLAANVVPVTGTTDDALLFPFESV
jgi:hypothetical protein